MDGAVSDSRTAHSVSFVEQCRQAVADSPVLITVIVLAVVFLFFALVASNFLSMYALSNVLTFASIYGIVTVGVTFLMISGEFDLSVGSVLALGGYTFLYSLLAGVPPVLAVVFALIVSALLGLINGLIVTRSGIPSLIATLGTLLAYRGIAHALGRGRSIPYNVPAKPFLFDLLNGYIAPINNLTDPAGNFRVSSLWFIGLVLVMTVVLTRTRYGIWSFSVGGNPGAALATGVNVKRVKTLNFVLSGLLAGFAGVVLFAQRTSMYELMGEGLELTVVAAAVIGGVSLSGGVGTIGGAALGIILLSMLEQGLVLMGVPNDIFRGVAGAIAIGSVVANHYIGGRQS